MSEPYLSLATLTGLMKTNHAQSLAWFLDIDGTLLDLAASPQAVKIPEELVVSLDRLARSPYHHVALISGRSLSDIDHLFPNPLLSKSGNHGAEYYCNHELWLHRWSRRFLTVRSQVLEGISALPEQFPGLLVEDKQYSMSIHYRHVDAPQHAALANTLKTCLSSMEGIVIHPAKLCWEIRPQPGPTKGDAVKDLSNKVFPLLPSPVLPVIIGDDRTDEDAFKAISPAITIHVGNNPTQALYRLNSPHQVRELLASVSRDPHFFTHAHSSSEESE